ncbi:hypothetical protein [Neorhizobium galegae]|uniref:hypothetical protein n=1 Tax=Neorhizobium galegae TaxID=399 RepID=UPI0006223DE8|nr:hypothetical protein [Neorhizobium galegae]CDZ54398.1 Hypothetical protein NGAL_HAMBI2427_56220 [Neorhizobium galegae bv. orientalis]
MPDDAAKKTNGKIVTKETVQALSMWTQDALDKRVALIDGSREVSAPTAKAISRRLSENGAKTFTTVRSLPFLLSNEVLTYCERIRIYPFTARYREALKATSPDMNAAWQLHSNSLRQSEVYVIQERGKKLLGFAHQIAVELDIGTPARFMKFDARFNKKFERRLRDRHRVVHAHEKPSLTSRVTDMMITSDDTTSEDVQNHLMSLIFKMADMLPGEKTDDRQEIMKRLLDVPNMYAKIADEEAFDMINIFFEELKATLVKG